MKPVNALLGRGRLLEIAAHIVATEGAGALTVRRLARDLGTSTMSLYSHFAGKDELIEATADEFVIRFADALRAVPVTDDALHDFVRMSNRYRSISLENRDLYRVALASGRLSLAADTPRGIRDLFEHCVATVGRCIAEGSLKVSDPRDGLMVFWTAVHGQVGLEMEHVFSSAEEAQRAWETCFAAVVVGLGADPKATKAKLRQANQIPH